MLIRISPDAAPARVEALAVAHEGVVVRWPDQTFVVTSSALRELAPGFDDVAGDIHVFRDDIQLASLACAPPRTVAVGPRTIGGGTTTLVAGPCAVESEAQIEQVARALAANGVRFLRAGAFKPRTSPYSFQGLGASGLALLRRVCDAHGFMLVSEVRDTSHLDHVIASADIVQVGSKAMYDPAILRGCGASGRPVLLKRHFGATLQEFVQAAEFILSSGNPNVILCERGIRTFETKTRFSLDLCGVAWLKQHVNLPVFVDPSHAMGYRYGVPALAKAAFAMGVDGLLIETHPQPDAAWSDAAQQISLDTFSDLVRDLGRMGAALDISLA